MSVQSDTSRIQYTGNASAVTPYPVPFVFHEATHIRVVVIGEDGAEIPLTLGTDYTVAGAGSKNGGNVTTKVAVPATRKVTIFREVPAVQGTTFKENDRLPAEAIERGFDRLTMICQQLARKVARTFRFSDSSPPFDEITSLQSQENSLLVSGEDGKLHLWSIKKLKEEIAAIAAVPAMLQALMVQYPVGCLYFTRRNENPRDILGFGTWRRFGSGRMIVSLDPSNPEFSQVDAVGGEATVALTADQNGQHSHVLAAHNAMETSPGGAHSHVIDPPEYTTPSSGAHSHTSYGPESEGNRSVTLLADDDRDNSIQTAAASGAHTHTINIPPFTTAQGGAHSHTFDVPEQITQDSGAGEAHNNMPPYIVVHVWTRINSDAPEEGVGTLPFPADPTLFVDRVTGETRKLVIDDTVIGTVPVA